MEMFWFRLFSSTMVSGHTACMRLFFAESFAGAPEHIEQRVEHFGSQSDRPAFFQQHALVSVQSKPSEFVEFDLPYASRTRSLSEVFRILQPSPKDFLLPTRSRCLHNRSLSPGNAKCEEKER